MTELFELDEPDLSVLNVAGLLPAIRALGRDLGPAEAGELVTMYYLLQEHRIALANQTRAASTLNRPHAISDHFMAQLGVLERQAKGVLDVWTAADPVGIWLRGQVGIGPVLAAGLLAHIDIHKAPTVGHIWSFAGLNPNMVWEKGQKRPYNARLKTLCWKIGDSFVKVSGKPNAYYGHLYLKRKKIEVFKNSNGDFAELAAETLRTRNIVDPKTLKAYTEGRLPDGRIDLRARRWAVKLLLAHMHHVWFVEEFGQEPPYPYPLVYMADQHTTYIPPPDPVR